MFRSPLVTRLQTAEAQVNAALAFYTYQIANEYRIKFDWAFVGADVVIRESFLNRL